MLYHLPECSDSNYAIGVCRLSHHTTFLNVELQFLRVQLPPADNGGTGITYVLVSGAASYKAVHYYIPAEPKEMKEGQTAQVPTAFFEYTEGKTVKRRIPVQKGKTVMYKETEETEYNSVPITDPATISSLLAWLDGQTINNATA